MWTYSGELPCGELPSGLPPSGLLPPTPDMWRSEGCTAGTMPAALHSILQKVLAQTGAAELRTLHMLTRALQPVSMTVRKPSLASVHIVLERVPVDSDATRSVGHQSMSALLVHSFSHHDVRSQQVT